MTKPEDKWNLELLFKSDNDPKIDSSIKVLEKASADFNKKWSHRRDHLENVGSLYAALSEYNEYLRQDMLGNAALFYFHLRSDQDRRNSAVKAKLNKLMQVSAKSRNQIEFFELGLASVNEDKQRKFLASSKLKPYRYYLQKVFEHSAYNLSIEQEQLLNLKSLPAHTLWVQMTSQLLASEQRVIKDSSGKKITASFEELVSLLGDRRKIVRDEAAQAFNEVLIKNIEIGTSELNAVITNKKIDDELRGYKRADQARHIADGIRTKTVDTLISTVSGANTIARDFYKLKAQLLGLPKLEYHERNVPYGRDNQTYSYSQATSLLEEVLGELDPEYVGILKSFLRNRQIDVYPHAGKGGGAYCSCGGVDIPTYILLNFTGKLGDVTTLAHEMGHAIHYELMKPAQPPLYFGTSLATTEVASQYFEGFIYDRLLKKADDELKLELLMSRLNEDISATFRQAAFYKFETDLHVKIREQGYLSSQEIGSLFESHMRSYMGTAVNQSPGSENWWLYVTHFRHYFYVYSYVSGLLIAKNFQNRTKDDHGFTEQIKKFFAAGQSNSTEVLFADIGVDVRKEQFWQEGLDQIKDDLSTAKNLAKTLRKL